MVVIRLTRGGANKRPFYQVVAADSRRPRDGRYLERLGYFNPISKGGETRLSLNKDRLDYWLHQGAQPSDTVKTLLVEFLNPELAAKKAKAAEAKLAKKAEAKKAKVLADAKAAASAAAEADKAKAAAEETPPASE